MSESRGTVLVVDDTPSNIMWLEAQLADICELLFATSGEEALALAQAYKPDLILLDILMPDLDGFETLRRLQEHPDTDNIPVIFITALEETLYEERGLEMGAVDFITRPFSPVVVRARVRSHLQLKLQRDLLQELSACDGLTGIANRRRFDEVLDTEWRRASRSGIPLALLLLDIDHFKEFNDRAGHLAGDACLRRIAQLLKPLVRRPGDLVARYGGEEFVILLVGTDHEGAQQVADQMRRFLEAAAYPHPASPVAPVVTVSIGAASVFPHAGLHPEALIAEADRALYTAKHRGRNQVVVSSGGASAAPDAS